MIVVELVLGAVAVVLVGVGVVVGVGVGGCFFGCCSGMHSCGRRTF